MNRRKLNICRWYALALALVLTAGCMMLSVGTAFARYRLDEEWMLKFVNRAPVAVFLGRMNPDQGFLGDAPLQWQEQIIPGDGEQTPQRKAAVLNFAVANYHLGNDFDNGDIQFRVRLIGTLNAWDPAGGGTMVLRQKLPDGTLREVAATVTPIGADTPLSHSFGTGWVFQFLDEYGQELTWTLKGGEQSSTELDLILDSTAWLDTSLLQLQVAGERIN